MDIIQESDVAAWAELETAAIHPESGFRYLNLCSVDAQNMPQARMVVLRRANAVKRVLEFHTDMRSTKWREFDAHPRATVLGYCPQTRLQLRLQGTVELFAVDHTLAEAAWASLPAWTRATYAGGPPGDELVFDTADISAGPELTSTPDGKIHFGVMVFRAESLDWFQLRRQGNRRARFTYDHVGAVVASQWLNP